MQERPFERTLRLDATADGSATLFDPAVQQGFHSGFGAATEARHVFLAGARLEATDAEPFRVLEVGFGTGLNFLVTADAARARGVSLTYLAMERRLPPADLLRALDHRSALHHPDLADALIEARGDAPEAGAWRPALPGVDLTVVLGDARTAALPRDWADALYHDAFSPAADPELWSEAFLGALAGALRPGGRLLSYCVQGAVRRRLAAAGLEVRKRPGPPGGKREVLCATRPELTPRESAKPPRASPTR